MLVQLNQTFSWTGDVGAHFEVLVNKTAGGVFVKTVQNGTANSILLSDLFSGVDFATEGTAFDLHVRSTLADGSLPSAWSTALQITVGGFGVPTGLGVS